MTADRPMLLDATLIRRRRFDLGLSERAVAKPLGVASSMIARIEDGTNHKDLPLGLLTRLADVLAVPLPALILEDDSSPVDPAEASGGGHHDESHEDDAARVGALLYATETLTPIGAVCDALDWTRTRTRAALNALDAQLRPAGLCVHELKGEVRIQRRADSAEVDALKQLLRRHQARRGLNLGEARVLADLLAGRLDTSKLSNPNQVALARLSNAGLVDLENEPDLSEDVRCSLLQS